MKVSDLQFAATAMKELQESAGVNILAPDLVKSILSSIVEGSIEYLSSVKGNIPQVLAIQDDNKKNIFTLMVEKMDNQESGGYTLSLTFGDDDDLPKDANVKTLFDPYIQRLVNDISFSSYGFRFVPDNQDPKNETAKTWNYIPIIAKVLFNFIKKYMINNIKIDKTLELEDIITIDAEESGNKVILKVTPSEKLKQHIKDDADISVA